MARVHLRLCTPLVRRGLAQRRVLLNCGCLSRFTVEAVWQMQLPTSVQELNMRDYRELCAGHCGRCSSQSDAAGPLV